MKKEFNIKRSLKELIKKFPDIEKIDVRYSGSGDSFSDFWDLEETPDLGIVKQSDIEDILWYVIDNSDADFNNDGSNGTITINLKDKQVSIDNYYIVQSEEPSGIKVFK